MMKALSFFIFLLILGIMLINFSGSPAYRALDGTDNEVHAWRKAGQCIECHTSKDVTPLAARNPEGILMTAPGYHSKQFRKFSHGRTENLEPRRCASCHEREACIACHNMMPESHDLSFIRPTSASPGMNRHILLARLRPSSCLVCHERFTAQCTPCHSAGEADEWQEKGAKTLQPWRAFLRTSGGR